MSTGTSVVDLFSGAGGFSLGFEYAGFEIAVASDYQQSAEKTYTANLDSPFLCTDIAELVDDIDPLLETGGISASDVDILIGGPPCKGFSTAGVYNPDDPRNSLLLSYIRVVEQLRPNAIVIENVPGAKSIDDGNYVTELLERTRSLGYKIRMIELNALNYGVPQSRNRLFFIGYQDQKPISPPVPTHNRDAKQKRLFDTGLNRGHISVGEAISDLSFLGTGEESTEYLTPPESAYQRMMRRNHDGPLYNHVAPDHSKTVQERFRTMEEGSTMDDLPPRLQTRKHSMRKYDRNNPSNTVTTLPEDFVHYEQPRIPTVRELARLQSFPDWFEFRGPRTTGGGRRIDSLPQYSQVGNAVPPIMAEAIARHMKATIEGNDPEKAAERRLARMEGESSELE